MVIFCLPVSERRQFLLRAQEVGMMDGSYAYLTYWFTPRRNIMEAWYEWEHEDNITMMHTLKTAMTSVKVVGQHSTWMTSCRGENGRFFGV